MAKSISGAHKTDNIDDGIYIVPMYFGSRIPCFIDVELIKKPH